MVQEGIFLYHGGVQGLMDCRGEGSANGLPGPMGFHGGSMEPSRDGVSNLHTYFKGVFIGFWATFLRASHAFFLVSESIVIPQ